MAKRKRPSSDLGVDPPSSPSRWSVYSPPRHRMTKRLFVGNTPTSRDNSNSIKPAQPDMSELLEFILQHEEAFQSRRRLASLYADFRIQLDANPDGFHANVSVWKKALADAARAGVIPAPGNTHDLLNIRTGEDLARALQHPNFGRPTCLPAVFQDAVSKREFLPLDDFLNSTASIYKNSWVPSPWSVLKWGLRQIGVLGQPGLGDKLGVGNFVVLRNVEAASTEVLKRMAAHTSAVDRVLSRANFLDRFADVLGSEARISQRDLDILLVHLARDKQAISFNGQTIKFKPENEVVPLPITKEDTAIVNIRDTLANIHAQIPPLEERIAAKDAAAREAVKRKQTLQAKAALRSKKNAESTLQRRTDVALQLEAVYTRLQEAVDQVGIVEAMRAGASALKTLNQKVGGAEGVSAVVDAIREEMATTDEISNIINESSAPVDETEIEDEFEALERADKEKREREEKAEREKREEEEAAKTAAKLEGLAQFERAHKEQRERELAREQERELAMVTQQEIPPAKHAAVEDTLEHASQDMARLSFQEQPESEPEDVEKEKVLLPA